MLVSEPITPEGLEHLRNRKYKATGYTPLDNLMNHYWEGCVKLLPIWMAPNLITLIGALILNSAVVVVLYYDMTISKELPSWVYFYSALSIFVYQTLDAIDGKQARRTGSSSPLGQLFDHGCDALTCTSFTFLNIQCLRVGNSYVPIFCICFLASTFFMTNWEEQYVEVLRTGVGSIGVTEGQLFICAIIVLTGIFGPGMWGPILAAIVNLAILAEEGAFIGAMMWSVLKGRKNKGEALLQLLPIAVIIVFSFLWANTEFYSNYPALVMITTGVQFFLMIIKKLIATVTNMYFSPYQIEPFVMTIPIIFALLKLPGTLAFYITFGLTFVLSANYVIRVIQQLTKFLGICCLTLSRPKPE